MAMAAAASSTSYNCNASGSSNPVVPEATVSQAQLKKDKEDYLQAFKRFDIFEDCPDHHFVSKGNASKQHPKKWVKRIQEDWKLLENDLPDLIYVRACESRMDLLRAVIIGAEGTPYHDGLFFFDIFFPDTYPLVPPKVHYHSGGLRINPNLYTCGTVCLSLLGTWSGDKKEKWIPKESTILQLLVSIQGLILNEKPYFNEPGYEHQMGTSSGETRSQAYSESTYISTLKTMVYTLRRPPQYFEEFVKSYFFIRALDIVYACKAYKAGAPVASVLRGGVQDLEVSGEENGSKKFKKDVGSFMKTVIAELVKIGVNGIEEKPKPPEKKIEKTPNLKRTRSSSFKHFLAYIGSCILRNN